MTELSEEQIEIYLAQVSGWTRNDQKSMQKIYRFKRFLDGVRFVTQVADVAERLNHHPSILIDYRIVTISLTTWDAAGLTDLDFTSAANYDAEYAVAEHQ